MTDHEASRGTRSPLTLIVMSGEGVVERTFDGDVVRIGRSEKNDCVVADPKASRFHCRIVGGAGGAVLEDAGSRNGTLLNGAVVLRSALHPGDAIRIGDTEIFFEALPEKGGRPAAETEESKDELIAALIRERSNLMRLAEITKALNSQIDLSRLLELIIDAVIELTGAERGFLITLDEAGEMEFEVARNYREAAVETPELAVSRSIAGAVIRDLRPVMSVNARDDERFKTVQSIVNMGLRSVLCVPLSRGGEGVGAVYVDSRLDKGVFTEENRRVVEAFADQAAVALENARRMTQLREANADLRRIQKELAQRNRGLATTVRSRTSELERARARLAGAKAAPATGCHFGILVGASSAMHDLVALLKRIIDSGYPVLIQGESGTGKDLVAQAIHFNGRRAANPFVTENCAALPESLLESELFGHVKGAFTGAVSRRRGLLELAHTGTLFLDEVGDMSPGMQTKLLRFLQDGEFRPVGSSEPVRVDVRILAASNRPLFDLVEAGRFREDLFYRLNVLPVNLPPLRERRDDIPLLVAHFLDVLCAEQGRKALKVEPEVLDAFCRYSWPGNVRDLENEMRRLVTFAGEAITLDLVSDRIRKGAAGEGAAPGGLEGLGLAGKVEAIERREIAEALRLCAGNKSRAARMLKITRFTLQRKLEKYGITGEVSG